MKILAFLVCDDIRNEIGNKNSLIGVYDDRILFNVTPDRKNTWPKTMKIGIFAVIALEGKDPKKFSFKMKYNEKEQLLGGGEIRFKSDDTKKHKFKVAMVYNNFPFDKPGKIKFTFEFFDKDGALIDSVSPTYELEVSELVID